MEQRIYQQMQALEDRHWWFRGRRSVIRAVLGAVPAVKGRERVVLDAGCGSGGNLGVYTGFGAVMGVDISTDALWYSKRRGYRGVGVASLPWLPFRDSAFDLVAATDVVEHVEDDSGALREFFRVTRAGGHLLVTDPAYRWLWSDSDVQAGHHRRYTKPQIVDQCRSAGWTVARTSHFNMTLLPAIAAVRWVQRHRSEPMVVTELERTGAVANRTLHLPMVIEARLVRAGVALPAGVSIICLCRKRDADRPD